MTRRSVITYIALISEACRHWSAYKALPKIVLSTLIVERIIVDNAMTHRLYKKKKQPNVHLCIEQKLQEGWEFSGLIRQIFTGTSGLANRISSEHLFETRFGRKSKIRNEVEYTLSSRFEEAKIIVFFCCKIMRREMLQINLKIYFEKKF